MKRKLIMLLLLPFLFSCTNIVIHHLNEGLDELENSRNVDEQLLDGYTIKKIGFFKIEGNKYKIALLLNDDVSEELVRNHTLGMHIKVKGEDERYLPRAKKYISWDSRAKVEVYNGNKYIIREVKTPIKRISSMRFFLYNLGKYEKRIGNQIIIKNIDL